MDPFSAEEDNHYIAYEKNAHIDTNQFEKEILSEIELNPDIDDQQLSELIYQNAFSRTAVNPQEPGDDALLCRYLSPAKFIQFLHNLQIPFPTANQFADE